MCILHVCLCFSLWCLFCCEFSLYPKEKMYTSSRDCFPLKCSILFTTDLDLANLTTDLAPKNQPTSSAALYLKNLTLSSFCSFVKKKSWEKNWPTNQQLKTPKKTWEEGGKAKGKNFSKKRRLGCYYPPNFIPNNKWQNLAIYITASNIFSLFSVLFLKNTPFYIAQTIIILITAYQEYIFQKVYIYVCIYSKWGKHFLWHFLCERVLVKIDSNVYSKNVVELGKQTGTHLSNPVHQPFIE